MTRQEIDAVLDRVRTWPEERQEDAAALLLMMEEQGPGLYVLDEEEERALDEAEAAADRGEFATEEEVDDILSRFRI